MRWIRLLVPLAGLVSLASAGIVAAHDQTLPSTVTLRFSSGSYGELMSGRVGSEEPRCKKGRTVDLYRAKHGADSRYGSAKTNARGHYEIAPKQQSSFPDGKYYARVRRKVLFRSGRHDHVCGPVTTARVRAGRAH
jgi:hypothetical protein